MHKISKISKILEKNLKCTLKSVKKMKMSMLLMYRENYLGQSISVCKATSRKVKTLPKDRAKKILFSRGIQKFSI
jgi:negative regulator of sigma E activity